MPPPVQRGERIEPARARPVPFWRHGLAPPPRTSPRVRVDAVPLRVALRSARTHSWIRASLKRASNVSASRSTPPCLPTYGALAIAAHLHGGAGRPRHRAPNQQQVFLGDHPGDAQTALGDPPAPHPARPPQALEHPGGGGRGADRARRADVMGPVRHGPAAEVVALDRPLEALALGDARHLDLLAGLEGLDGHGVPDRELGCLVAELDQMAHRWRVRLLEVAQLGPGQAALLDGAEAQLHRLVAVALGGPNRGHRAGAGLQDG